jgi:hypothetical protein
MPAGNGGFLPYLHAHVRRASGRAYATAVEVALAFDDEYVDGPADPMPQRFMAELQRNALREAVGRRSRRACRRKSCITSEVLRGAAAEFPEGAARPGGRPRSLPRKILEPSQAVPGKEINAPEALPDRRAPAHLPLGETGGANARAVRPQGSPGLPKPD